MQERKSLEVLLNTLLASYIFTEDSYKIVNIMAYAICIETDVSTKKDCR